MKKALIVLFALAVVGGFWGSHASATSVEYLPGGSTYFIIPLPGTPESQNFFRFIQHDILMQINQNKKRKLDYTIINDSSRNNINN